MKIRIIEKQSKVKELADVRRRVMEPLKPGEMVLVRRKPKKKGKTKKFLPKFTGPFQVVKQVGSGDKICPTTYLVEDPPERRTKKKHRRFNAHLAQIRKFRPREVIFEEEEEEQTPLPVPQPEGSSEKKSNKEPKDMVVPVVENVSLAPSSSGRCRRLPTRLADFVLSKW